MCHRQNQSTLQHRRGLGNTLTCTNLKWSCLTELCTRTDDDADIEPESVDTLVKKYNIVTSLVDHTAPVANNTRTSSPAVVRL